MRVLAIGPKKIYYQGNAAEAVLPAQDGEISVLDFHQPGLFSLGAGLVRLRTVAEGAPTRAAFLNPPNTIEIKQGVARVWNNELILTIET